MFGLSAGRGATEVAVARGLDHVPRRALSACRGDESEAAARGRPVITSTYSGPNPSLRSASFALLASSR